MKVQQQVLSPRHQHTQIAWLLLSRKLLSPNFEHVFDPLNVLAKKHLTIKQKADYILQPASINTRLRS